MSRVGESNTAYLGVQQSNVFATKDLGNKSSARLQDVSHNGESRQDELSLDKLIHVMQSSDCTRQQCISRSAAAT